MKVSLISRLVTVVLLMELGVCLKGPAAESRRDLDAAAFQNAVDEARKFTMPGEFDPIESVWLAYPVYENLKGRPT